MRTVRYTFICEPSRSAPQLRRVPLGSDNDMGATSPAWVDIIQEFVRGRLSLDEAAPRLAAALRSADGSVNFTISPKMRPLLKEVYRLQTGQEPPSRPPFVPIVDRHKGGNLELLSGTVDSFWKMLRTLGRPTTLDCVYHAETESIGREIAEWLQAHGNNVTLQSPLEADEDDWVVHGKSPVMTWTRELIAEWVETLRAAPLKESASIMGVSVLDA